MNHATPHGPRRFRSIRALLVVAVVSAGAGGVRAAANQSVDRPATVAVNAERVVTVNPVSIGPGVLFPMNPFPRCELVNGFGGPSKSGQRGGHQGLDIGGEQGQEVYAVEDGVLHDQWTSLDTAAGLGWSLHGDSTTRYRYFHLSGFAQGLSAGDRVKMGQLIGYVGDTGNATPGGWHLHFEVRPAPTYAPVDPLPRLMIPTVCKNFLKR